MGHPVEELKDQDTFDKKWEAFKKKIENPETMNTERKMPASMLEVKFGNPSKRLRQKIAKGWTGQLLSIEHFPKGRIDIEENSDSADKYQKRPIGFF